MRCRSRECGAARGMAANSSCGRTRRWTAGVLGSSSLRRFCRALSSLALFIALECLQPIAVEFQAEPTAASAFFSITTVVYYALGAYAGRAADRFGPRAIVAVGATILGLGLSLSALVNQIWAGYLTYGIGGASRNHPRGVFYRYGSRCPIWEADLPS